MSDSYYKSVIKLQSYKTKLWIQTVYNITIVAHASWSRLTVVNHKIFLYPLGAAVRWKNYWVLIHLLHNHKVHNEGRMTWIIIKLNHKALETINYYFLLYHKSWYMDTYSWPPKLKFPVNYIAYIQIDLKRNKFKLMDIQHENLRDMS